MDSKQKNKIKQKTGTTDFTDYADFLEPRMGTNYHHGMLGNTRTISLDTD
jgi:hypothetical protein